MNRTWRLLRCGCLAACGLAAAFVTPGDIGSRYWRVLNEGRDIAAFENIAEQLTFPARRKLDAKALGEEAAGVLAGIENSAPVRPQNK